MDITVIEKRENHVNTEYYKGVEMTSNNMGVTIIKSEKESIFYPYTSIVRLHMKDE